MEIRNRAALAVSAVMAVYLLVMLLLPTQTTCGVVQSRQWHDGFIFQLYAGALLIFVVLLAARLKKLVSTREVIFFLLLLLIFLFFVQTFYVDSIVIAECQGTVLSDNWWSALNWIKDNTAECAVVATYWDPGHFITGIAKRSVVFDGASQGALVSVPAEYDSNGMVVEKREKGIDRILLYENGNVTRARIQDIATTLLTSNETLAVDILNDYRKPGCDEMYYIASSDLIGKSTWWTYFATWSPLDAPEYGQRYNYLLTTLESARPVAGQNAIAYSYRFSQQHSFVLYESNDTLAPFLQQQNQFLRVQKLFYFDRQGNGRLFIDESADVPGMLWLEGQRQTLIFMQPELEDALFTRMFFFDGSGLERFEFINSWGGEVKLFRVKF